MDERQPSSAVRSRGSTSMLEEVLAFSYSSRPSGGMLGLVVRKTWQFGLGTFQRPRRTCEWSRRTLQTMTPGPGVAELTRGRRRASGGTS